MIEPAKKEQASAGNRSAVIEGARRISGHKTTSEAFKSQPAAQIALATSMEENGRPAGGQESGGVSQRADRLTQPQEWVDFHRHDAGLRSVRPKAIKVSINRPL